MIVCLGWGSLIWCNKKLPVRGPWMKDGPLLPIEFARESQDRRITLVICEDCEASQVLWAELDVQTVGEARLALAVREGIRNQDDCKSIGFWTREAQGEHSCTNVIGEWARERNIAGVVWTALRPKIGGKYRKPNEQEVIDHLDSLNGAAKATAEEYVRLAPRQIQTPYRQAIERALGWTPSGLV